MVRQRSKGTTSRARQLELCRGVLEVLGSAQQTSGTFQLRDNATIRVGGPDVALRIYGGSIIGAGTVDANLTLGYDTATFNGPQMGGYISPGYTPPPGTPGGQGQRI